MPEATNNDEINKDESQIPLRSPTRKSSFRKQGSFKRIFESIDTDGDGVITRKEYNRYFERTFTRNQLDGIFRIGDADNDGRLDYKEFVKILWRVYGTKYYNFIVQPVFGRGEEAGNEELYEIECTCRPPILGMVVVSVVEIIFFVVDKYVIGEPIKRLFKFSFCCRQEIWRFLTYSLMHSSTTHLCTNIGVQLFFGIFLEMYHGWYRILPIYLSGVIAGSLATSVIDPGRNLVGASAGVYAMLTAHVANIIMNWGQLKSGTYPGLQLLVLLIISATDLATSLHEKYAEDVNLHVGCAAHLGGAVAGLLVGIGILRNIKWMKHENVIWWLAAILFCGLMVGGVFWNVFYTEAA